jgi:hypothetical protein
MAGELKGRGRLKCIGDQLRPSRKYLVTFSPGDGGHGAWVLCFYSWGFLLRGELSSIETEETELLDDASGIHDQ